MPDHHRLPAEQPPRHTAIALAPRTSIEPPSLPQQLAEWDVSYPLPTAIGRTEISQAMARYEAALSPPGIAGTTVLIDPLFAMARARNIPFALHELMDLYLDELSDLPADLLEKAVKATRATWKWANCMPSPAEIREHVSAELGRRKRDRGRLQLALQRAPLRPRDRSDPVDDAAAREAFSAMKASIAAAAPVRMMERRQDDAREPEDVQRAVKRGVGTLTGLTLEERIQRAKNGGVGC